MSEKEKKVAFRNKKINLLEAKLYLVGLNLGFFNTNLDGPEMEGYVRWENRNYIRSKRVKELLGEKKAEKKLDERQYLIEELKNQIQITKNAKERLYCANHNHKELKNSANVINYHDKIKMQVFCSRCNSIYEREPTQKELDKISIKNYNPFSGR